MTRDQAIELVAKLRGLLPTMTNDQASAAEDDLVPHDYLIGWNRLDTYSQLAREFNRAEFLRVLGALPAAVRTEQALAREAAHKRNVESEWGEIDKAIASVPDEELSRLADEVVEAAEPAMKPLIAGRNPRKARLLKSLVYQRLHAAQQEAHA